jgi:hypothetical protein
MNTKKTTNPPAAAAPAHRRFHAVVASEVIEHVESPQSFLQALTGAVSLVRARARVCVCVCVCVCLCVSVLKE